MAAAGAMPLVLQSDISSTSLLERVDAALLAAMTASAWSEDTTLAVVRVLPLLVPPSRGFRKPSASVDSRGRLIATVQICDSKDAMSFAPHQLQ
jgi:hypothetical protein